MYSILTKKHTAIHRGFSLIEVLVALSIFAVVVTMAVGSLLVLMDANSKAQNTQQSINNVSFALDAMVRDIRTGYFYYCSNGLPDAGGGMFNGVSSSLRSDCTSGADGLVFTETGGSLTGRTGSHRVGFRHFVDTDGRGRIERRLETGLWQPVTAPEVDIETLDFVVTGSVAGSNRVSPLVTIYIEGAVGTFDNVNARFALQTTVTQQLLDL
jgi:prepilin-type N-terminal cleavage/methylation domain-containing protein